MNGPQSETMCYIATKPCGCLVAAILDKEPYQDSIAKTVMLWIKDGLKVARVSVEFVQLNWLGDDCPHQPGRQLSLMN